MNAKQGEPNMSHTDTPEEACESNAIAVVGMSGRFPGARNVDEFWRNLCEGKEAISFFSDEELRRSGVDPHLIESESYVRARGILGDPDLFAASFFGYSPRVAALMDPQHRIFIECAWEAAEKSGYDFDAYPGRVGVFAGCSMDTYFLTSVLGEVDLVASVEGLQAAIGNDKDSLTTEVAYRLNLRGPAVTIQSSSSTSLVAVHYACQSLLSYECDMALSGGISIHFPEKAGYLFHEGSPNSPTGHCRAFDHKAQGFVPGHGAGVVVLKRQSDALRDGDHIHALIRGSACNNDGTLKVSYMAPSVEGQVEVVALAQALADVAPSTVGFVECHGTGTELGDPIEVAALREVFAADSCRRHSCALGAVKTNIGHLDTAAGVVGLIKTVLAVEHGRIPPTLHFEKPNPELDLEESPFYVATELEEWPVDGGPRRAGVTSLGMGGTNAHVVLEEAPEREGSSASRPWQILCLSARTATALESATDQLAGFLGERPQRPLADVAFTLQVGRRPFEYRRSVLCRETDDAVAALSSRDPERLLSRHQAAGERPVVWLLPGQGSQYWGMGQELYDQEPTYRHIVDECVELLADSLGPELRRVLVPGSAPGDLFEHSYRLQQVSLFVVEYALAQVWLEWGLIPEAMIGHSLGELAAACLAGVFSLPDALRVVEARAGLVETTVPGAMLSVSLPGDEARELVAEELWISLYNAPDLTVLSGTPEAAERLAGRGVECRRLRGRFALHSPLLEPVFVPFCELLREVNLNPPKIPFISNLTGTWIEADEATLPEYWGRQLCEPVRFSAGVEELLSDRDRLFIEVGPGKTLGSLLRRHERGRNRVAVPSLRHARDAASDTGVLPGALQHLWLAGAKVDWAGFSRHESRRRLPLPTYPFERQSYWIEPRRNAAGVLTLVSEESSRGAPEARDPAEWFYVPLWRQALPAAPAAGGEALEWLIFTDEFGLGAALADLLESAAHGTVRVVPGPTFEQLGHGRFAIDPERPADYESLFKALIGLDRLPRRVVHLWSLTDLASREDGAYEEIQKLGFSSLMYLAQAFGQLEKPPAEIAVVTNGTQRVTGREELFPEKATLLGPCRTLPFEYADLTCRTIDVDLEEDGRNGRRNLPEQLVAELLAEGGSNSLVALRGGGRWSQVFERLPLETPAGMPHRLRPGGVYLVTGGLGGLGLEIAHYLARVAGARLVLLGRSAFPAREEWSRWLDGNGDRESIAAKIRKIHQIEEDGGEVLILRADVTDRLRMREAVARAREHFGGLHGVVHAAGLPSSGTLQLTTPEMARAVLAPKVDGTRVLESLFEDGELDFLVLFSSQTAIVGGIGQADYCGANAFLDAYAHARTTTAGTPVLAIGWNAWREVGLWQKMVDRFGGGSAPDEPGMAGGLERMEPSRAISPEQGQDLFGRLLTARGVAQIVVSPEDLETVIERARGLTLASLAEGAEKLPEQRTQSSRPDLMNPYVAPRDDLERAVAESWQRMLGIDKVGVHDNFFELGGNSLLGVKLCADLNEDLGRKLPMATLYENPTVSALAQMIAGNGGEPPDQEALDRGARRRGRRRDRAREEVPV